MVDRSTLRRLVSSSPAIVLNASTSAPNSSLLCGSIRDRKSTRLNSSHDQISYAVFCLKKKKKQTAVVADRKIRQRGPVHDQRLEGEVGVYGVSRPFLLGEERESARAQTRHHEGASVV